MNKILLSLVALIVSVTNSYAQSSEPVDTTKIITFTEVDGYDLWFDVIHDDQGNYISVGEIIDPVTQYPEIRYRKTDVEDNIVWEHVIQKELAGVYAMKVEDYIDNKYVIACNLDSVDMSFGVYKHTVILVVDDEGNELSWHPYGDDSKYEFVAGVDADQAGNIYLLNIIEDKGSGAMTSVIHKIDSTGAEIATIDLDFIPIDSRVTNLTVDDEGGIFITAQLPATTSIMYVAKLDNSGNFLWDVGKSASAEGLNGAGENIMIDNDTVYVLGQFWSVDSWEYRGYSSILVLDEAGNELSFNIIDGYPNSKDLAYDFGLSEGDFYLSGTNSQDAGTSIFTHKVSKSDYTVEWSTQTVPGWNMPSTAEGASVYEGRSIIVGRESNGSYSVDGRTVIIQVGDISTGANDIEIVVEPLKVYPNPATDMVNIEVDENCEVTVFSTQGQMLFTKNMYIGNNVLDLSGLKPGTYVLRTQTDEKIQQSVLIKH